MRDAASTSETASKSAYRGFKCLTTRTLRKGAGSATLAVKLHTITESDDDGIDTAFGVVEKCLPAQRSVREIKAYKLLSALKNNEIHDIVKHPRIFSIIHSDGFVNVFMEHINGARINFDGISAESAGRALGIMSRKYGRIFPDEDPFNNGRAANPVLKANRDELAEILDDTEVAAQALLVVKRFNRRTSAIKEWQSSAKRALCHGDVKSTNVILSGTSENPTLYFIDWASVSWDCSGTDIGGLFLTQKYAKFEDSGESEALERRLYRGYAEGLETDVTNAFLQDIEIAANLHFAVRFFSWAVKSQDKSLLLRSVRRAERVLRHFT